SEYQAAWISEGSDDDDGGDGDEPQSEEDEGQIWAKTNPPIKADGEIQVKAEGFEARADDDDDADSETDEENEEEEDEEEEEEVVSMDAEQMDQYDNEIDMDEEKRM